MKASQARRRIAHVVRQYEPSIGGLETYVQQLAALQSERYRVYIITLDRIFGSPTRLRRVERRGNLVIIRIPFFGSRQFFLPALSPKLQRRFCLLHVHATDQLLDATALFRAAPFFVATHGLFFHTERLRRIKQVYFRLITRFSLKRSRAVFAVSANDADRVRRIAVEPVLLRNPIVPLGNFVTTGGDFLYIGRLAENKQIDKLLEFARHVAERRPEIGIHIVGSDPDRLEAGLRATLDAMPNRPRVHWHGFVEADAMEPILRRCGFIVSASRYEGFGLSIIEGMSVGLLPVMHDNAAFRETFQLSGCGVLLDFDEPAKAAAAFLDWRETVSQPDRNAAANYAHGQSWPKVVDVIDRYYEAALRDGG